MQDIINNLQKLAKDKHKENKTFFTKLKKKPPKQLDYIMQELHEEEFERTDCLTCGNCCKTTGPLFTDKDMEFPANPAIATDPVLVGWGPFKQNLINVNKAGERQAAAVKLMDRAGYK